MRDPNFANPIYAAAVAEQNRLRSKARVEALPSAPGLVGGADVSFNRFGTTFWGGIVVCDAQAGWRIVDEAVVRMEVDFPYIPGLLGFREVPVLVAAWERLRVRPAVLLVDAHGMAHPRRLGSAAHLGVALDVPTVGCAKSRLCGEFAEPKAGRGAWAPLMLEGEVVGCALRTRAGVKPLFVSVGHRADLDSSRELVLRCCPRYRIPEPIRLAHKTVNAARLRRTPTEDAESELD